MWGLDSSAHVMVVVRVRVLALPGAMGQGAVVAVWVAWCVHAAGAIEQRQSVGEFVMEVMAALWKDGATVPVAPMDPSVEPAGDRKRGVLENVAVHFRWLVQVAWRVIFCSRQTEAEDMMETVGMEVGY